MGPSIPEMAAQMAALEQERLDTAERERRRRLREQEHAALVLRARAARRSR